MGKKGKKGKKGGKDKATRPTPVTTLEMLHERTKMLCPRLGDVYTRTAGVGEILEDVAIFDILLSFSSSFSSSS